MEIGDNMLNEIREVFHKYAKNGSLSYLDFLRMLNNEKSLFLSLFGDLYEK